MSRKILILEPFCKNHMDRIREAAGSDFLIEQLESVTEDKVVGAAIKDAEIVVGQPSMDLLQNVSENIPELKLIQMTWAGTDIYTRNIKPFPKQQVMLANASGAYGMVISQFVIGQILSLMLNFKIYHEQQEKKIWKRQGPIKSLEKARVLIYGAGDIGTTIAKRLSGFDTYTIGVCRDTSKERSFFNEVCTLSDAEKFLPEVDVVIGCIPNTKATVGYFNEERLRKIKKGSILVNVGRGNFVDCNVLNSLLEDGSLWGAALDVTNPEPLPLEHPLWTNPRCMITPHASGVAFEHLEETENLLCDLVCENIRRYRNGEEIKNRVEFQ